MSMLVEVGFTEARNALTNLFDGVCHRFLPAIIRRRRAEDVLLVRRDLQQDILRAYVFKPEVLHEEDGTVTLALDELELAVNADDLEKGVNELAREMRLYADDYKERLQLFLQAPNRRGHFPYVFRIWLCNNDEEIRALLEI